MERARAKSGPIRKMFEVKSASLDDNCIKGAAAVMGNLDAYYDVIFPGFFKGVLPDFLQNGFVPVGHAWSDLPVAMPVKAQEKGNQLYTEAVFHGTPAAQEARQVCMERMAAGKSVGLSIGFWPDYSEGIHEFGSGADLLTFAEGLGHDMNLFDVKGLKAHKRWCTALTQCKKLYEYSIVSAPANDLAVATEVKGLIPTTEREFEEFLRDAGYSRRFATAITLHGFKAYQRDAEQETDEPSQPVALEAEGPLPSAVEMSDYALTLRQRVLTLRLMGV